MSRSPKSTAVFGLYPSITSVEIGVEELKAGGFRSTDISVLFPESAGTRDFVHEKSTKAPEGATAGAGAGLVVGGALGWLVGIGALAIPGIGPFVAAGPIVAALAGVGVVGTLGGIAGALLGMGVPEYEAKQYAGQVESGVILLSVHSDSDEWTRRANDILRRTGAQEIASTGEVSADEPSSSVQLRRAG